MTLDEMEKLARATVHAEPNASSVSDRLARALLTVLPVVRAAEEWHSWHGSDDSESVFECESRLYDTIDQMRAAIGERK